MSIKTITQIQNEYLSDDDGKLRFNSAGCCSINVLEPLFEDLIATLYNDLKGIDTLGNQDIKNAINTIAATYDILRLNPTANRTLVSTPTISNGISDGQIIRLFGNNVSFGVTIQDERTLSNSGLRMNGGVSFTLGKYDQISFMWDSSESKWIELFRSANSGS